MAPPETELDADRIDDDAIAEGAAQRPAVSVWTRIRVLTLAALGPLVTGYAAIAALLALITAIATKAHFSTVGVLSAATPSWLAAHQVPVSIFGMELGVLPLLPTIGLMAITARAARGAAERLELDRPGQTGQVIGTIALAHGVFGVVLALISAHKEVSADPLASFYYPTLVAALAATIGVARRCGLLDAIADRADTVAVAGLRTGALAVVLLLTAGGALFTFGLLTSVSTARDLFPLGIGNALGMLLLSIGYLPNAIVAATSFVAGPGFSMGAVVVGPLEFTGGPVPGLPLLAALPEETASWWPVLFVLPLGVGVLVGRRLRDVAEDPVSRLRGVAVAAGVVALGVVVLAGSAGGRMGSGPFDPVSMRAAAVSVALVLWIAIPAAITAWLGGPRPTRDPLPGLIEDDEDATEEPHPDEDADTPTPDSQEPDASDSDTTHDEDAPPASDGGSAPTAESPTSVAGSARTAMSSASDAGPAPTTKSPASVAGSAPTAESPPSGAGSARTAMSSVSAAGPAKSPDSGAGSARSAKSSAFDAGSASTAKSPTTGAESARTAKSPDSDAGSAPIAKSSASEAASPPTSQPPAPRTAPSPTPQPPAPRAASTPNPPSQPEPPAPRAATDPNAASGPPESTLATDTDNSPDRAR